MDSSRLCKTYLLPTMYFQGEYEDTNVRNEKGFYDKLIHHEWNDQHNNGLVWWEIAKGAY